MLSLLLAAGLIAAPASDPSTPTSNASAAGTVIEFGKFNFCVGEPAAGVKCHLKWRLDPTPQTHAGNTERSPWFEQLSRLGKKLLKGQSPTDGSEQPTPDRHG